MSPIRHTRLRHSSCLGTVFSALLLSFLVTGTGVTEGMTFLQFATPAFRDGLVQHDMLGDAGFRLHNTGFDDTPFGARWRDSELLQGAKETGKPYYIDRIMGGMPFQSLEGIEGIAAKLKDDPNFLGFQAHEWANSPTHDYHRIHQLILDKGLPFAAASFTELEGSMARPYFSSGDFELFQSIYRELKTQSDVEAYLSDYFKALVARTEGQLVSVTGHGQVHHTALRLGAKNVMAEIGNQVPLTAFQIACARGAGKQHGKPFGAYYEPWGGRPTGCICATDFSPWWPHEPKMKELMDGYNIGPQHGSSRSLQRRLLYYAWLSGAAWWSEEWGAENYFSNWEDYPLTTYGKIVQSFQQTTASLAAPRPIVPVALVMPRDTFGIDIRYMAGFTNTLWRIAPEGDAFHDQLRRFGKTFLATQRAGGGGDVHNLTPSPWIGCFDVFDDRVSDTLLQSYEAVVYFDASRPRGADKGIYFDNSAACNEAIFSAMARRLPYTVDVSVGMAQAVSGDRVLVGVFNNLGVTKTTEGEQADPKAFRIATVTGNTAGHEILLGKAFVTGTTDSELTINIPAGEVVLLSFPAGPSRLQSE